MKKLLSFSLFLVILFSLSAETYYSNELGQIIDDQDSIYRLSVTDNRSVLYREDTVIRITEQTTDGDRTVLSVQDLENNISTIYTYNNSFLSSVNVVKEDGTEENTYFIYSDGILVCTEFTDSEGKREVEYYLRNDHDLSLFAVRRYENTDLLGQDYIYTDNSLFTRSNNVVASGNLFFDQDENISFTRNGIVYTYGPTSLLLKEESDVSVIEYTYVDSVLEYTKETSKTEPGSVTLTQYVNGEIFSQITEINGIVSQSIEYKTDNEGMVKTFYTSGKPVARVYYRQDNRRVIRVEYL